MIDGRNVTDGKKNHVVRKFKEVKIKDYHAIS